MNTSLFNGTKVCLTAMSKSDAPDIAIWYKDSEFLRLLNSDPAYPLGEDAICERIERQQNAENQCMFGIRLVRDNKLIGTIGLDEISWPIGVAYLAIGIGERSSWGKGYGHESCRLLLDYAFNELNLHRVQLTVFDYNQRAIKLYEKLGFQREGVSREYGERDGKRYDMYHYGLLSYEWRQSSGIESTNA